MSFQQNPLIPFGIAAKVGISGGNPKEKGRIFTGFGINIIIYGIEVRIRSQRREKDYPSALRAAPLRGRGAIRLASADERKANDRNGATGSSAV